MPQREIDWNTRYDNGSDYMALYASDLLKLLSHVGQDAQKTALDIGCGTGQICRDLVHHGYQVAGIDLSEAAIKIARRSTSFGQDVIQFILGDILDDDIQPPFTPYGLIISKYTYKFMPDKEGLLEKVKTLLHPNGTFVVINPNPETLPPDKKQIAMDHQEVTNQLNSHFDVESYTEKSNIYYICKNATSQSASD